MEQQQGHGVDAEADRRGEVVVPAGQRFAEVMPLVGRKTQKRQIETILAGELVRAGVVVVSMNRPMP